MNNRKQIESIQLLRLIAAIGIFLYHSGMVGQRLFFGVEIFNIISGYLAVHTTSDNNRNYKHYFLNRLVRIIPLYWATTILTYLLLLKRPELSLMSNANWEELWRSLLFVPYFNPNGNSSGLPIVAIGWTLYFDIFFNLVFYISMCITKKYRSYICGTCIIILIFLRYLIKLPYIANYYFSPYLLEYIMGMLLYPCIQYCSRELVTQKMCGRLILLFGTLSSYIYLCSQEFSPSLSSRCIEIGIPSLVFVTCMVMLFSDIRLNKPILFLSKMTYSFYFMEYFSTAFYKLMIGKNGHNILLLLVTLCGTFLASIVVYNIFEKSIPQKIKNLYE